MTSSGALEMLRLASYVFAVLFLSLASPAMAAADPDAAVIRAYR
jgi:hypothetical protein